MQRIEVHGNVRLQGAPLARGTISFLPLGDQSGPPAIAAIGAGSFRFDRSNGPAAGKHRVIVRMHPEDREAMWEAWLERSFARGRRVKAPMLKDGPWELEVDVPTSGPFQYDVMLD